jgi:solute carrier family 35 (UDP-sugar transporter), member A1/2/3
MSARFLSLLAFVVAHTFLSLGLRFSAIHGEPDNLAISSTEVFLTELTKLVFSVTISFCIDARGSVRTFLVLLEKAFVDEGVDLLKLCVPSVLYTIQNNLQYVIETAPLFMVMYQMKIITTAIFFSYMLQRRLTVREWLSVIALAFGVSMAQSSQTDVHIHHASNFIGVLAVIFACLTSGFAGVYFEKTLKSSKSSIWMINVELSLLSTALAMFACLVEDTEEISRRGFLHGYNQWVVLVIVLQAIAGLAVAVVVKYSDNIHKGFAASVSTVLTSIIDYLAFNDTNITKTWVTGTIIIVLSNLVFVHGQQKKALTEQTLSSVNSGGASSNNSGATGGMTIESGGTRERLGSSDTRNVAPNSAEKSPHLSSRWVQRLGGGPATS